MPLASPPGGLAPPGFPDLDALPNPSVEADRRAATIARQAALIDAITVQLISHAADTRRAVDLLAPTVATLRNTMFDLAPPSGCTGQEDTLAAVRDLVAAAEANGWDHRRDLCGVLQRGRDAYATLQGMLT